MSGRRVLVTGAGGFVGQALTAGFQELGWRVTGLDRAFDGEGEHAGVHEVNAELAEGVPAEVGDVDLVVHAAWVTAHPATLGISPAAYMGLNLRPLLAVLEHVARSRPPAFVFLSSSGVFAPEDATDGLTDAHHPTGTSPYAAAKRAGEAMVPAAVGRGTAAHLVRLGHLFGPGEVARVSRPGISPVAGWLAAAREGRPLAVPRDDPRRDWTFTGDLAAALARVVEGPSAGRPIHVGSPHVWHDGDLARLVASRLPGSEVVTGPTAGPTKPPMVPSDVPALRGFEWSDPHAGLERLLAAEVTT